MAGNGDNGDKPPPLAMIAGAIGFVLTLGLIGFIGWEAFHRAQARVPAVEVQAGEVHRTERGYVLEFDARNTTSHTAAAVQVEATLTAAGAKPVVSSVTLDYIPGHSTRKGGIFLPIDPSSGDLKLRALGYAKP